MEKQPNHTRNISQTSTSQPEQDDGDEEHDSTDDIQSAEPVQHTDKDDCTDDIQSTEPVQHTDSCSDEVCYSNLQSLLARSSSNHGNADACEDQEPIYLNRDAIAETFFAGLSPLEAATAQQKGLVKHESSADLAVPAQRQSTQEDKTASGSASNTSPGIKPSLIFGSRQPLAGQLAQEFKRKLEIATDPDTKKQSLPRRAKSVYDVRPSTTAPPSCSSRETADSQGIYENFTAAPLSRVRNVRFDVCPNLRQDETLNQLSRERSVDLTHSSIGEQLSDTANIHQESSHEASQCIADDNRNRPARTAPIRPDSANHAKPRPVSPVDFPGRDATTKVADELQRRQTFASVGDMKRKVLEHGNKILNTTQICETSTNDYEYLPPAPPVPKHSPGQAPSPTVVRQELPRHCSQFLAKSECQLLSCRSLHVCADWLTGRCGLLRRCRRPHSLCTAHNLGALRASGWEENQSDQVRRWLIFQARCEKLEAAHLPPVCVNHARGICSAQPCDALHICPRFLLGACTRQPCPLGHELFQNESNRQVVMRSGKQNESPKKLLKKIASYLQ